MRDLNRVIPPLLLAVATCGAQTQREHEPRCSQNSPTRVQIADTDATILGLAIGQESLKDVQATLGRAQIVRVSSDEESDVALCYESSADGTVLIFYSSAMGAWQNIIRFALWSRNSEFSHRSQCTKSALVSRNIATESGLRLGLTTQETEAVAGRPTERGSSTLKYEYVCRQKMTDEQIRGFKTANNWDVTSDPYFDRMSWIKVNVSNSTGSHLEVGRIESY
jgi:hypothetical protein